MRIGNLRHRVTLTPRADVQNAGGEWLTVWDGNNEVEVSGSRKLLRGEELMAARKIESLVQYTIMIRNSSQVASLDHAWRAQIGSTFYAIHAVAPYDARERWLILYCSEGITDQAPTVYGATLYDVDGNPLEFVGGIEWHTVD